MANQKEGAQSESKPGPHELHAFLERPDLPVAIPRPPGPVQIGPELPVARTGSPACAICGRPRSDRLHAESEEAAQPERWPL
jgi:hypothetical protein